MRKTCSSAFDGFSDGVDIMVLLVLVLSDAVFSGAGVVEFSGSGAGCPCVSSVASSAAIAIVQSVGSVPDECEREPEHNDGDGAAGRLVGVRFLI